MRKVTEIYLDRRGSVMGLRYTFDLLHQDYILARRGAEWFMKPLGQSHSPHRIELTNCPGLQATVRSAQDEADRQRGVRRW